jgi:hypothetical protein
MAVKKIRKNTRFKPDPGTYAEVKFPAKGKSSAPNYSGLVLSEAFGGCSMVLVYGPNLANGDQCNVKVGNLTPLLAEVRWVIALDENIQKVGFKFLE